MKCDLRIDNACIIDGTGSPRFMGSVAVSGGRIVSCSPDVVHAASQVVDAQGLVLAPGFVDIHTHYDAQVLWDPFLTISPWHGVTTAVMGACGFGIAPTRPSGRQLILRTLERVEAMSISALQAGLGDDWPFESFAQYLDTIETRGTAINVGVMVGHTPVRLFVMGEEAVERAATESEITQMQSLVFEAMQAGALGFATSVSTVHYGFDGKPVPSRLAEREEMLAMARAVRDAGHGIIHYNVARESKFDDYVAMHEASGATVCWTAVLAGQLGPWRHREVLARNDALRARGLPIFPQVACRPIVSEFSFESPVIFDTWALFDPVRRCADQSALIRVYSDPEFRAKFSRELAGLGGHDRFFSGGADEGRMRRASLLMTELSNSETHSQWAGRKLVDLAREQRREFTDLMLDIALQSGLKARFRTPLANFQDDEVQEILSHPDVVLGLGDGGAHLSQLCDACYPTHLLGHWVRERKAFTLEQAVHMLSGRTAAVFEIAGRGRIAPGFAADLVLFDPDRVAAGPLERVCDLPARADRLISKPQGVEQVWVNGQALPAPGHLPEAGWRLPGQLIRGVRHGPGINLTELRS
ncbi:MAG: amidohydrolase family protein [Betaproteobacteria bacterium]|nr:amidohydrolase family protein [Betaproteobacteria bacterium]